MMMACSRVAAAAAVLTLLLFPQAAREGVCEREYSCSGCSQVRICRQTPRGLEEAYRMTCTGSTPYCDAHTGTCVSVPVHGCGDQGLFRCQRDGTFPDPDRSSIYHICANGTSYTLHCKSGECFDGRSCSASGVCYTLSCSGKTNTKVAYKPDPNVFAYCLNNNVLFVDRCPPGTRLYSGNQQCLANCSKSGTDIPDPSDCTKYQVPSDEPLVRSRLTLPPRPPVLHHLCCKLSVSL